MNTVYTVQNRSSGIWITAPNTQHGQSMDLVKIDGLGYHQLILSMADLHRKSAQ